MTASIDDKITLPCGAKLNNRIAKGAMTEGLATASGIPTEELARLYGLWSDGGCSMLLTGNIQIDKDHLERPGNVVIDKPADDHMMAQLKAWSKKATRAGNHCWVQLSHAGRQTPANVNPTPKAASPVKLGFPGNQFGQPVALTETEIEELIRRFAQAAKICQQGGFTGVQLHAAHGYLLSSFLSPRANLRDDKYGGSLANRARFLLDAVKATRKAVGPDFPLSVKLNSADFQKGGFAFEDSITVAKWLQEAGIDLLEISGGNYEQPKLIGMEGLEEPEEQNVAQSTKEREAYFVDFALAMKDHVSIPLMVTGGFRTRAAMDQALQSGAADLIGIGRPMCVMTDAANQLLGGLDKLPTPENELTMFPPILRFLRRFKLAKAIEGFGVQNWYYAQLLAFGRTGTLDDRLTPMAATKQINGLAKELLAQRG